MHWIMYLPVPKKTMRRTGVAWLIDDLLQAMNFCVCCL
jgi:hypothetical protein